MKVGILGSGSVAQALAQGFIKHGHQVMVGTRDPGKLADWQRANSGVQVDSVAQAGNFGELLILAVKGSAAIAALQAVAAVNWRGKTIIDATNPIADAPPVNGVLQFFTDLNHSLMERLQQEFAEARFVKAFNSVGAACMVNPTFAGGKPTMFIAGNDAAAKQQVTKILDQFGWEVADMGKVEAARAIEPLCMLWCIPGFANNDWVHAFKLLR